MKKKLGVQKKEAKLLEHVHMLLLSTLDALTVNTAAGCYSSGQALVLNALIPTYASAPGFNKEKSECSESFESFTMSFT